jgi:glutathione S-transferase
MILYTDRFWISPYVFSSFVALSEKGLEFDTQDVALDLREQLKPQFRDLSLTARVPLLIDGDFVLTESSAIAEYLEEKFPQAPSLFPKSLEERARARMIMAWLRSDLSALRVELPSHTIFYTPRSESLSTSAQNDVDKLVRIARKLVSPQRETLFQDWSLVDAELAFMLQRLLANGVALPQHVAVYARQQWLRPSARVFVEKSRDPYVTY